MLQISILWSNLQLFDQTFILASLLVVAVTIALTNWLSLSKHQSIEANEIRIVNQLSRPPKIRTLSHKVRIYDSAAFLLANEALFTSIVGLQKHVLTHANVIDAIALALLHS